MLWFTLVLLLLLLLLLLLVQSKVLPTPRSVGDGGVAGVAEGAGLNIQGRRVSPELPGHIEGSVSDCLVSFGAQDSGRRARGAEPWRTEDRGGGQKGADRVGDLKLSLSIN